MMNNKEKKLHEDNIEDSESRESVTKERDEVSEKKSEVIEHGVILALSLVLLIVGACLKNDTAKRWLYTLSFVITGYEVLYSTIVKLSKKAVVIEEIAVILSSLILLYLGYGGYSCLIVIFFSLPIFGQKILQYIVLAKSESLSVAASYESDEKAKSALKLRAETLKFSLENSPAGKLFGKKFKFIFNIVGICVGLIVAFIPPIFGASDYLYSLQNKWLICGTIVVALWQAGVCAVNITSCYIEAFYAADRRGVLFGSFDAIDNMAAKSTIAFDCAGVVTEKEININKVSGVNPGEILSFAYAAENGIDEYFCSAISIYAKKANITLSDIAPDNITHTSCGVSYVFNDKKYAVGNKKFVKDTVGISVDSSESESIVYVATEDGEIGEISYNRINKVNVTGEIKEISEDLGIETVLLSGDGMKAVQSLQAKLGFNRAIAGATPEYKAEYVKNNNAVYAGDFEGDRETIETLNGNCITIGGNKIYENGATADGDDVRQIPIMLKIAKRTRKKNKFITALYFTIKSVALIAGITLFALTGRFLWVPVVICFIADLISSGLSVLNVVEPS